MIWTDEQIAALRAITPKDTAEAFGAKYGISKNGVVKKAWRLGIKFAVLGAWEAEDLETLTRLCGDKTAKEIAAILGRNEDNIHKQASRMGMSFKERRSHKISTPRPRARDRKVYATPVQIIRVTERTIDYCPQCHAPVSNWSQHYERMDHIEPRLQAWYEQQAAKRSA